MATKVIVNAIGQHIIADVKQVQEKETEQIVAYMVGQPRLVVYSQSQNEDGTPAGININFADYCLVSAETEFTIRAENVVAILEPRPEVAQAYTEKVTPPENEESSSNTVEDGADAGSTDGAA